MSQAKHDHTVDSPTLSRRSLLAISAAAVAGAASASTSGALAQTLVPGPDAALLDLCAQWDAHRRECDSAYETFGAAEQAAFDKHRHLGVPDVWVKVHTDPAYREADARSRSLTARSHELFQAIGQARATTLRGIMAKARVTAAECLEEGGIEEEADQYNDGVVPQYMALTLVRDLLAMHSAGDV